MVKASDSKPGGQEFDSFSLLCSDINVRFTVDLGIHIRLTSSGCILSVFVVDKVHFRTICFFLILCTETFYVKNTIFIRDLFQLNIYMVIMAYEKQYVIM